MAMPVFRFTLYDISTDQERPSKRWATREAIDKLGETRIEDSLIIVEEALLGREIEGMTDIGFQPAARDAEFQKQVKA